MLGGKRAWLAKRSEAAGKLVGRRLMRAKREGAMDGGSNRTSEEARRDEIG